MRGSLYVVHGGNGGLSFRFAGEAYEAESATAPCIAILDDDLPAISDEPDAFVSVG